MSWRYVVPPGHLISGLSVKYYSDMRKWIDCTRKTCTENEKGLNVLIAVPQTLMIDLDTVYISNPFDPVQIWKPIEYSTGSARAGSLGGNDVFDVKFPPDYFLAGISFLKDPNTGGAYGLGLAALKKDGSDVKLYNIGQAWNYPWGPDSMDNPKGTLMYYLVQSRGFDNTPYMVELGGLQSTRDNANHVGQFMTFDGCKYGSVAPMLEIAYPGDRVYKCCFFGECPDQTLCPAAKRKWCDKNPTEYSCRRREGFSPGTSPGLGWLFIIILVIALACAVNFETKSHQKYAVSGDRKVDRS